MKIAATPSRGSLRNAPLTAAFNTGYNQYSLPLSQHWHYTVVGVYEARDILGEIKDIG